MNASPADVTHVARRVNDHPATEGLARLGYVSSGVLHLMLGFIVVRVAWFGSTTRADQSGALATLASHPLGKAALWLVAVGFAGLAVWQLTEAVSSGDGAVDRMKAAAKGLLYVVLGWTSLTFAQDTQDAPTSTNDQSQDFSADLMAQPGGRILVAVVGLIVLTVAAFHVHKGWTQKFLRDLEGRPGRFIIATGRLGYVAKGVALGIVASLFVAAALHARPDEAGGLDLAFRTLAEQPFGSAALTAVAAGLVAYGAYSFARARFARA